MEGRRVGKGLISRPMQQSQTATYSCQQINWLIFPLANLRNIFGVSEVEGAIAWRQNPFREPSLASKVLLTAYLFLRLTSFVGSRVTGRIDFDSRDLTRVYV